MYVTDCCDVGGVEQPLSDVRSEASFQVECVEYGRSLFSFPGLASQHKEVPGHSASTGPKGRERQGDKGETLSTVSRLPPGGSTAPGHGVASLCLLHSSGPSSRSGWALLWVLQEDRRRVQEKCLLSTTMSPTFVFINWRQKGQLDKISMACGHVYGVK